MTRWTCPQCGGTIESERIVLPVSHSCGFVDDGETNISTGGERPPLVVKAKRYVGAVARWTTAGFPTRSQPEIDAIYDGQCRPCEFFVTDHCGKCACAVNSGSNGLTNKIAMATERCPVGKW